MSLRPDDLPALALFAEVVRARSFSEAGRRMQLAKSAVSKRVAQLEARLGVRLLTRTTRKLALTQAGAEVYEQCTLLLEAAARAVEVASGASELPRGIVRMNAPATLAQLHLASVLTTFLEAQPEIELVLSTENRFVDVMEGSFDLVLRVTRALTLPTASSLVAKRLASSRLVVCAATSYLARQGTPEAPTDLVHHRCLHYELVRFADEWRFRGESGPFVVPARSYFQTSDGSLLREMALRGAGLAVLPWFMVARDVEQGRLTLVLEGQRRAAIGIYALFPQRAQMPLRTRLLLNFLSEHFAQPGWEQGRDTRTHT